MPQIPHRIGEELGGAARYVIREGICPFCRLVRDEVAGRTRLVYEDSASVCFAPYASRSPFELWVVPRHHAADFGHGHRRAARQRGGDAAERAAAARHARRSAPTTSMLHTAPLRERVDETYHWHWEIHPRLREIAGLELGTGLPVNPVSPEEAVAGAARTRRVRAVETGVASGPRSWDEFANATSSAARERHTEPSRAVTAHWTSASSGASHTPAWANAGAGLPQLLEASLPARTSR